LKESGVKVVVGLKEGSKSVEAAKSQGLTVMNVSDAAKSADIVMMLVPDEISADIYNEQVAPHMKKGDVLVLFPNDVHKPELNISENNDSENMRRIVTKVVFKIEINKINI